MEALVHQVIEQAAGTPRRNPVVSAGTAAAAERHVEPLAVQVTTAAHDALFSGNPKVIGAVEDAAKWRGLDLPDGISVLLFGLEDGVGRIAHPGDDADAAVVDLALPPTDCLGLFAFSDSAEQKLTTLSRWWSELSPGPAPEISRFTPGAKGNSAEHQALRLLVDRMLRERRAAHQNVVRLQRALGELREDHETSQSVLAMLRDCLSRYQLPTVQCTLTLQPGSITVAPPAGAPAFTIRQKLPVHSQGLAAIALHVAVGRKRSNGRLLIKLTARESGTMLISWAIPFDHLTNGWNLLEIPSVIVGARQTVDLTIRWDGDSRFAPQLSLSDQHIGPGGQLQMEGGRQARQALALQIWTGLPGSRRVVSTFAEAVDGQIELAVGKQLFVSPAKLAQAKLLEPAPNRVDFDILSFKEDGRTLQLHPVTGLVSHAVIPAACPAGVRRILATIKTDCPEAPWVEYALMAVPAGTPANFPTDQKPAPAGAVVSEWLRLAPNTPGTLVLAFDDAPSQTLDLHLATRMPPGVADAFAWAQWKSLQIELA